MKLEYKNCPCCKIEKKLDEFPKDKTKKTGRDVYCKECKRKKVKKHYLDEDKNNHHREYIKKYNIKYYSIEKNKIKRRKQRSKYDKDKYKNDPLFKIKILLRRRVNNILNYDKKDSIINLIGCSVYDLRKYIESQFLPEFNWDNHGKIWELDHIKPCSKFDLTKIEEQQECFNYKNLKPIFKTTTIAESFGYKDQIGNRNKSNKY
jgi:hypothetical protein